MASGHWRPRPHEDMYSYEEMHLTEWPDGNTNSLLQQRTWVASDSFVQHLSDADWTQSASRTNIILTQILLGCEKLSLQLDWMEMFLLKELIISFLIWTRTVCKSLAPNGEHWSWLQPGGGWFEVATNSLTGPHSGVLPNDLQQKISSPVCSWCNLGSVWCNILCEK